MIETSDKKVVVSAQIGQRQREELARRAVEQDRTISYLVRQAVGRYRHELQTRRMRA